MISHVVALEDLPTALDDLATGNAGKVIVDLRT
jgi:hypothetical protein